MSLGFGVDGSLKSPADPAKQDTDAVPLRNPWSKPYQKAPCTYIVYTPALKYLANPKP